MTAGALAVLRRVDADPYRDAVRDAILAGDGPKVQALSKQAAAPEQPPGFVAFLCSHGALEVERRRQLLEAAVSRRPGNLLLLMTLGNTYPIRQKASANERLRWFQAAVAAAPANPSALSNLGNALCDRGQLAEAIVYHKKAVAIEPNYALYHTNLGVDLAFQGDLDGAIVCFEKALALDPNHALGHYNLGLALDLKKSPLDKVLACYTRAVELDPDHAEAQCNLAQVLARQGKFGESVEHFKRGHELGTKRAGWPYPSAEWLRQAEEKAALEAKLPALLAGEFRPGDNKERLGLAEVCYAKKLPHAATGLYASALGADPGLADDQQAQHRYNRRL
jgi:tetratricopeptide (TPR) repeat protein